MLNKSWLFKKIAAEFNVSNRVAWKAKKLVKEKDILCTPNGNKVKFWMRQYLKKYISTSLTKKVE